MAQSKADLLAEAKALKLEVTEKHTIAQLKELIDGSTKNTDSKESIEEKEVKIAKAGKRSEKGIKEAEEKIAKAEAQQHRDETEAEADKKPKQPQRVTTKLDRRAKGYRKSAELIEKGKAYSLKEALVLVTKTSHVKFDAGVELHINLGVDPRQADQNLRDVVVLPAGTGKTIRVAVADEALLAKLDKGVIEFDILVTTPDFMPKLGKYARVLGPKGLMPNPKSGTVTTDIDKAVEQAKAGRVEYRVDTTGIVHVGVGKVSFGADKLGQNIRAIFASIKHNKPTTLKGTYVQAIHLATTMGPSIKVEISEI